jgi:hypothetical protein
MSKPSARIAAPDALNVLIDLVEVEFLRAEAKERGYNIPGTAEEHYNNAIKYSILLGGSAKADLFKSTKSGIFDSCRWLEAENWFSKMDRYNRPFETWTEMRRLDHPQLPLAENAISGFPTD